MNQAYFTAFVALAGSTVGALASLGTTWLTESAHQRAQRSAESVSRREHLYGEFIEHASKLHIDALTHELEDPSKLVSLYALLCKLRLFAPNNVLSSADQILRQIVETYSEPKRELQATVRAVKEGKPELDLLRGFSQACREDLHL